jgi:hypothetical protein
MATTPIIADGHPLAVRPARVNIFARSGALEGLADPAVRRSRGVFDEAAACGPTDDHAARSAHGARRLGGGCGELDRRGLGGLAEWQHGQRAGGPGPASAARAAGFPREHAASCSAPRREASSGAQAPYVASSCAIGAQDIPRAATPATGPGDDRAAAGFPAAGRITTPGSERPCASPTAPGPRGARRPARVHVNGGSDGS